MFRFHARTHLSSQISRGSRLRCQGPSSRREQIRQRRRHPCMAAVLEQPAESNLAKAEHALDRPEDTLHPCAGLRPHSVRLAYPLVDAPIVPTGMVGQILGHRRDTRERRAHGAFDGRVGAWDRPTPSRRDGRDPDSSGRWRLHGRRPNCLGNGWFSRKDTKASFARRSAFLFERQQGALDREQLHDRKSSWPRGCH